MSRLVNLEVATTEVLDRCPFCGRDYARMCKDHPADFYFYVQCKCCYARTASEYDEKSAARNWNRRK